MIPLLLQLRTVLAFAAISAATWSVGSALLPWCGVPTGLDRRSRVVWEFAVGLLAWGSLLALLGFVGLLYAPAIVGLTLAAAAAGAVRMQARWRDRDPSPATSSAATESVPLWLQRVFVGCGAAALLASFLAALAPPLAGDALCYHLELPKRFLADHALTFYRDNDNSTFPLLTEMWFLWGLAVDGPVAAQLMHWLCGAVLAGAAYVLALPLVGRRWSVGVAAVTLLAPGINNQMTAPLNDVALALFTTLALAAWLETARDRTFAPWRMLGLMMGGALAVKYTALVFAGVVGVSVVAALVKSRGVVRAEWIRGACVAVGLAVVVAGPWYMRSAYYRADPLFPFLSAQPTEGGASRFPESKTPLGRGVGAIVEAPWAMTMEPERFGGRAHQLGPLFLMLVPCLALSARRRELRPLLLTAALYGTCCVMLRQNVRFLFPLVPLLAVAAIAVLREIGEWERLPRRIACSACGVMLLFLAVIPIARVRSVTAVALGIESREAFLARREPTFASAAWINANLPADARVLSQEQRAFYYEATWTRENVYRRYTQYNVPALDEVKPLENRLKDAGFTHLFLAEKQTTGDARNRGNGYDSTGYDSTLSTLADLAMAARPTTGPLPVREWRSEVAGEVRRYRLLQLR